MDVLRSRIQVVPKKTRWSLEYWSLRRVSSNMFKESPTKWFPGLGMTLVRAVPRFVVVMGVTESCKTHLGA